MGDHEHLDTVDPEDRRFKICSICGREAWRTDEELLREAGFDSEREADTDDGA